VKCFHVLAIITATTVTGLSGAGAQTQSGDAGQLGQLSTDPAQWPMAAHDYANTRFSTLDEITPANAGDMRLAWTFSIGANRGQEAAPLIINNTMYVVAPYFGPHPNQVFALDATTGDLKWS
jgi:lanthanide-dependent methanol dehydrogenase